MSDERGRFSVPDALAKLSREVSPMTADEALSDVVDALADLSNDERARVLRAATAFYGVQR